MEINKIYEITFDADDTIIASTLSGSNELVMLMSTGDVIRYNINERNGYYLFSVKSNIIYSDGGFDITAKSTIYTLNKIVVIVNDYKRHGFIHYPSKYHLLHLQREAYYADISCYPITLFENEEGVPHIIYGVAWNHIQIMNLATNQVLTASKSLIEENAEEKHIELYKKNENNNLPWPMPYDYFFGKLFLSPNKKKFISSGWAWGSCDLYNIYDIDNFIRSNRIANIRIGAWEHENRAVCWIDDETVAVTYIPFKEGDEGSTADSPAEIHFYKIDGYKAEMERKIQIIDQNSLISNMYYNKIINSIVAFSDNVGLLIISLDGQIVFKDDNLKIDEYKAETDLLVRTENKTISVYEILQ